ncbi:hypothetical protein ACNOYE_00470 [Nannocystaceae bacterium ST9]
MTTPTLDLISRSLLTALACMGTLACGDNRGGDDDDVGDATTAGESGEASSTSEPEAGDQDGSSSADTTQDADADTTESTSETSATESASETSATESASETSASETTSSDTADTADTADTSMGDVCNKVDFLFVIDNSISMLPEQNALSAAFPGFIQAIEDSLDTDDHILVTDTDLIGWCTPGNCANPNNLHPTCEGPNSYACTGDFDDCDITLGAGVVRPAGQGASNTFCDPFGGNRYIVETEPDKLGKFDCMAHVGLAGFPQERPVDAIVQAVSPGLNQGGCNDAFLRDDAILVVTFISDDDGNSEVNTMPEAYDAIVAAKGGDADRIVMLGLIPAPDNNCSFTPGAGEHWLALIEMFGDRGLHGPSCDDDYVPFFQNAVDVIVQACQDNPQ